jgi:hypothetical protein
MPRELGWVRFAVDAENAADIADDRDEGRYVSVSEDHLDMTRAGTAAGPGRLPARRCLSSRFRDSHGG